MEGATNDTVTATKDELVGLVVQSDATMSATYDCLLANNIREQTIKHVTDSYCATTFNGLSCWPASFPGTTAIISCPATVQGAMWDSTNNASRVCLPDGLWAAKADYSLCQPLDGEAGTPPPPVREEKPEVDTVTETVNRAIIVIYYTGYGISLLALIISLLIFLLARSLHCLRNTIHCNLMITFVFSAVTWILNHGVLQNFADHDVLCKMTVTLFNYVSLTNFSWMFIEGLYLYLMIVRVFNAENASLFMYLTIGYGAPIVVVMVWAIVKHNFDDYACWLPNENKYYDYICIAPILIILLVNVVFLISIMWVLVSKLQEQQMIPVACQSMMPPGLVGGRGLDAPQFRKGAKGLLILLPLLGTTYILVLVQPDDNSPLRNPFKVVTAILVSTQGLSISILYCFLNGEVRQVVRRRFPGLYSRWRKLVAGCAAVFPCLAGLSDVGNHVMDSTFDDSFMCDAMSNSAPMTTLTVNGGLATVVQDMTTGSVKHYVFSATENGLELDNYDMGACDEPMCDCFTVNGAVYCHQEVCHTDTASCENGKIGNGNVAHDNNNDN